jgi:hypothetical protein
VVATASSVDWSEALVMTFGMCLNLKDCDPLGEEPIGDAPSIYGCLLRRRAAADEPMIDVIRRHNRLNGILFSIAEFACIMIVMGGFGMAHIIVGNFTFAVVEWGIALNCIPIIAIGVRTLKNQAVTGERAASFWNKQARQELIRENPQMLRDTLTLGGATLIPFGSLAVVAYDLAIRRRNSER